MECYAEIRLDYTAKSKFPGDYKKSLITEYVRLYDGYGLESLSDTLAWIKWGLRQKGACVAFTDADGKKSHFTIHREENWTGEKTLVSLLYRDWLDSFGRPIDRDDGRTVSVKEIDTYFYRTIDSIRITESA